jgi:hypothetical protein
VLLHLTGRSNTNGLNGLRSETTRFGRAVMLQNDVSIYTVVDRPFWGLLLYWLQLHRHVPSLTADARASFWDKFNILDYSFVS